jgi:1,4-alpha-glucan branching enzyme
MHNLEVNTMDKKKKDEGMGITEIKKKEVEKSHHSPKKKPDGEVKFVFYAPEAKEMYLSGDFIQWDTHLIPMKKGKEGLWKAKVKLLPGRYEYKFIVDGQWVLDIPGAERVPNAFGTENFVIWV